MNNYAENMFSAIDLIVQERIKGLQFDKTIVCSVEENKGDGLYLVSDGTSTFEAYSEIMSYPVGMQVNVLLPQGDYNNQKTITGRYISNSNEITNVKYMRPFDNCLDITGNEAVQDEEIGLLANDNNKKTEIVIWTKTYNRDIEGFTRMGVSADFYAALSEFSPIAGSYGLHIHIDHETIDGSKPQKDLYLDSSDMYGNPYYFDTYFKQEKVFDISNMRNIGTITVSFYQEGNFKKYTNNNENQTEQIPHTHEFLGEQKRNRDNLKVNNLYLFFGYDADDFAEDTVLLFSKDSLKYNIEDGKEKSKKLLQLRWVRSNGTEKYVVEQNELTPATRIHWYIYDQKAEDDLLAGDHWKELIPDEGNGSFTITYNPILNVNEQKVKAILTNYEYMDETYDAEEEAELCTKYESNELTFISTETFPDWTTTDVLDGLKINISNDTYDGNYRIYGENGFIKRASETTMIKSLIPVLEIDGEDRSLKELEDQTSLSIKWKLPESATMIIPQTTSDVKDGTKVVYEGYEAKYKIKNRYNPNYVNNTVECEVTYKGKTWKVKRDLYFGTTGTHGTDYTFVIEPNIDAYVIGSDEVIELTAKLYDYNDEEIDPSKFGTSTVSWSWYDDDDTIHAFNFISSATANTSIQNPSGTKTWLKIKDNGNCTNTNHETHTKTGWSTYHYYNIVKAEITVKDLTINGKELDEKGEIKYDNNNEEIPKTYPYSIKMTAYYAIPIRRKDTYFMNGPTRIVYDSSGALAYRQNDVNYELVGYDNAYGKELTWEIATYPNNSNSKKYLPTIQKNADDKYYLSTKSMFIQDLPKNVAIVCRAKNDIDDSTKIMWAQPLLIQQEQWESGLLNQWDGSLTIDDKNGIILSTMMGAGIKNGDNTFSGVLMGDVGNSAGFNKTPLGLYGFYHGEQSFGFKIDGTAFIGRSGIGRIEFDGTSGIIQSAAFDDNQGMQLDLTNGVINAHQFTIDAKNEDDYIRFSNISPFFIIRTKNNNADVDLIHIEKNKYYIQSKNFTGSSNSKITGDSIQINLSGNNDDKCFQISDFLLQINNFSDNKHKRISIHESSSQYPLELGTVSSNSITAGIRIAWDGSGTTQWSSNFNGTPQVQISTGGILLNGTDIKTIIDNKISTAITAALVPYITKATADATYSVIGHKHSASIEEGYGSAYTGPGGEDNHQHKISTTYVSSVSIKGSTS